MICDTNVLVTGGAGAIGSNLVARLCHAGNSVVVLDDMSSGYESNLRGLDTELIKGSCEDDEMLRMAFRNRSFDYVFHLAANFANQNSVDFPRKDLRVNGLGTLKILEYFRDMPNEGTFIFSSSSCVYGNVAGAISEQASDFNVDTPYGITKLLGERYVNFFHEYHNVKTCILRYFNSFGPGEYPGKYRNVVPNFIAAAIAGKPLRITGTGDETRDFNYIDNVVTATIRAAESEQSWGQTFNVASGVQTRIRDIADKINRITGNKAGVEFGQRRTWDTVVHRCGDPSKLQDIIGGFNVIDIDEGLVRTYEWIRSITSA